MTLAPPPQIASPLARLDSLLEREILRLRARYQLSLDEFRGLYVSDEQVDRLVADGYARAGLEREEPAMPLAAARPRQLDPRWAHLVQTFALSEVEEDLVLIALAAELDLKYETLYAYLNNDVTRKAPTADLARRLLADTATPASTVGAALAAGATLRRHGLIALLDPPDGRPSLLNAGFAPHPALTRYLCGLARDQMSEAAERDDDAMELPDASFIQRLARVCAGTAAPVLILQGGTGRMQRGLAAALAARLGMPLCEADLGTLRAGGTTARALRETWALEQRLEPAVLYAHDLSSLLDHERRLIADAHRLLEDLPAPLLLACEADAPWRELLGERRALPVPFEPPGFPHRRRLWHRRLHAHGESVPDETCAALSDQYLLDETQIRHAVDTACDLAVLRGAKDLGAGLLREAAQWQSQSRLGTLAAKVAGTQGWDDLVLPPPTLAHLHEIAAAIRARHVVYADWGFSTRVSTGSCLKVLFAGASGTGKTMAAGVIAREIGLELYRIDLSGVVSKYIGETEKNLDRIFEAARAGNAILFFDEADAIFGKRSEVKDAHDRYANIETAYLLQKLETHDGVVILASNLKRNMDEAFARRMHHVVDFPQPDVTQRERLWRGIFPAAAPLADDVDFAFLARGFELAGGDIRNVALDAAFIAAHDGQVIGMRQLVQALARQMTKQGRTPSPSDFQRYYALMRESTGMRS
jgi:hypothetical protein